VTAAYGWQFAKRVAVPAGGSISVELPAGRDVLEALTIWAVSAAVVSGKSFQLKINGVNLGAAVAFVGPGVLSQVVFQAHTATGSILIPKGPRPGVPTNNLATVPNPFDVEMVVTDTSAVIQEVTVYMTAIGRPGG
jgi:hypothetical protein